VWGESKVKEHLVIGCADTINWGDPRLLKNKCDAWGGEGSRGKAET